MLGESAHLSIRHWPDRDVLLYVAPYLGVTIWEAGAARVRH